LGVLVRSVGEQRAQLVGALDGGACEGDRALVTQIRGDLFAQSGGGLRSLRRVPRRRSIGERGELLGDGLCITEGFTRERRAQRALHVFSAVARLAGEDLMQRGAEEKDVGARVDLAGDDHLRRHVRRRPAERLLLHRTIDAHRRPPIAEIDLAVATDEDVLRFDVAMHHAAAVREVRGVADLHQDLEVRVEAIVVRAAALAPDRMRGVGEQLGPLHALDALHDQHRSAFFFHAERVHRDDRRVLEVAGDRALRQQRESFPL